MNTALMSSRVEGFDPSEVLRDESAEVRISTRRLPAALGLFQTMPIQLVVAESPPGVLDCVLFGGGSCWTLDWCPIGGQVEYLAISCHPKQFTKNTIGAVLSGVNIIQIWSIRCSAAPRTSPMEMELGLLHRGALCWDLQWCPDPRSVFNGIQKSSLGLLAMALGNGEVQIISVPVPESGRGHPTSLELDPIAKIHSHELSGSIVSCIDWLPISPHDLLLLGCWDGCISIWGLPCSFRTEMQHLIKHQIDYLAIRRVGWLRGSARREANGVEDTLLRNCFCVVGHSGRFSLWNSTDLFQPLLDRSLSRTWLMDLAISANPMSIFIAVEDGGVRQLPLEVSCLGQGSDRSLFHHYSGDNTGAILTICCSDKASLTAYGGEDGEILVFPTENLGDNRYRKPHLCAGKIQFDPTTNEVKMLTASEVGKIGGAYIGRTVLKSENPDNSQQNCVPVTEIENQTIQCLKFSPNGGHTTWLAAGTISGFVRLIRISK